jgi:hypothetical protein
MPKVLINAQKEQICRWQGTAGLLGRLPYEISVIVWVPKIGNPVDEL